MGILFTTMRIACICALLVLVYSSAMAEKRRKPARVEAAPEEGEVTEIRIKFVDGSSLVVEEVSETEQGIWYRLGGISHLVAKNRVKAIQRGTRPLPPPQIAKVVETNTTQDESVDRPAWIFLKGGAKVEADSAIESAAGVWFRRGSLTIFIDRSRVDHVEREDPDSLASDASGKKARGWTTGNSRIDSLIRQNGAKFGVDPYLIFCVMEQESHFNPRALSPKGARGLMQLMPGTAARFGVRRASDPAQNIAGGTRYLKQLIQQFDGRIDLVLASYNAGEGAVMKFGRRVPPYRETREYVKRISYRYRRSKPAVTSRQTTTTSPAAGI